jgi:hypothetical protein
MLSRPFSRAGSSVLVAVAVIVAFGCGPNYKARALVKGKVTDGHRNLTSGTIVFHSQDGITSTASIDPEGNYSMPDAPIGDVKITVTVSLPPPRAFQELKDAPKANIPTEVRPISEKYAKLETSPLTYKVEKGEHVHNIELTP